MERPLALIIEDDEDLSEIFAEAVTEAGFTAEIISRGDRAMSRLAETAPEIVILDIHLPRVSGERILRCIRTDPRLAGTRIVITTADDIMAQALEAEADLTLLKPIGYVQLRDLARHFLSEQMRDDH